MAKIYASDKRGFSLDDVDFHDLTEGSDYLASSNLFRVSYGGGAYDEFRGEGFKFGSDGFPTGGTVKEYEYSSGSGINVRLEGVSVKATDIGDAARTISRTDDLALINRELAGKDTFFGGDKADAFSSLGGADKLRALDVPVRTLIAFDGH